MARLFFKSMFTMFLWLIVFINILFAFDILQDMPLISVQSGVATFSDKYFGMSTLIQFIQSLDVKRNFPFLADLKDFITNTQNAMNEALAVDFNRTFSTPIVDWNTFWSVIGDFFVNVFRSLGNLIVQISMLVFWIAFYLMYFFAFIGVLLKMLSGSFYSDIPAVPDSPFLEDVYNFLQLVY